MGPWRPGGVSRLLQPRGGLRASPTPLAYLIVAQYELLQAARAVERQFSFGQE
jgi:hypothetical protein